ncbi:unnamed protein product [Urochloa humidicola]
MSAGRSLNGDMLFILWPLLLLSYTASSGSSAILSPIDNSDLLSLLDFKQAITKDPTRVLRSWNRSIHFCRWKGVTCSPNIPERRVIKLELVAQSLEGQLSPSLGNLTSLVVLNLSTNSLSGQLPPLCYHLHKLHVLDLSNNLLHGIIPDGITNCSKLRKLDLYGNSLQGSIPREIGLLSYLSMLELSLNNLTGTIPETVGNVSSLTMLHLTDNLLVGSIPSELGKLSKMVHLLLGGNGLSDRIPAALFNLTLVKELDLDSNVLGGMLPWDMGNTLPNLQILELGGNGIEGPIPPSLGNASGLTVINIPYNNFSGYIPVTLGKLQKISSLNLERNKLQAKDKRSWEFLGALSNCSLLELLSVYGNQLEGVLPNTVGNLSSGLQSLLLGTNYMSGTVPISIGNLNNLTKFSLAYNSFTGKIEEWLGNMKKLQGLNLRGNRFNGPVPSSIGNLTQLSVLYLGNNIFEGVIPSSLGNLQQLSVLDLSYNNLHGNIPKEIFTSGSMTNCVLSYNNFEGMLPLEVENLQQLNGLHLSSNVITGEIPGTLARCQELETIKMDQNLFTGNIPESLAELKSLSVLNLSHNNLSGAIPTVLGDLKLLTQLDLSYNHLNGEIPIKGVFKNTTAVSLKGNLGLCGGQLDLLMPSCHVASQRKGLQYYIIRALIPVVGFITLILSFYFVISRKMSGRVALSLPSFYKEFPDVSYKDLLQATSNFSESNLIGRGSCSSVYRGQLFETNVDVAVKVFDLKLKDANTSFVTECEALRGSRHRNLISIVSACSTLDRSGHDFKAIVYDYMPNGNLEKWLHPTGDTENPQVLGLTQRLNIAINIADALEYLHHDCQRPIIHCDIKPSNILLDVNMVAHLGDFGISHISGKSRSPSPMQNYSYSINSASMKGTIGYIAPEYAGGGHISTYGDVYSFGVVLLEIFTGKSPIDPTFHDGLTIVNYVEHNFPNDIDHVIDANLQGEFENFAQGNTKEDAVYSCLLSILEVALSCTRQFPTERMKMREVSTKLNAINALHL